MTIVISVPTRREPGLANLVHPLGRHCWHQATEPGRLEFAGCCQCAEMARVKVNRAGVPFVLDEGVGRHVLGRYGPERVT